MPKIVDIVVPVYRGEAETRTCLESLLASPTAMSRHLIVVDDASPEPALSAWLRGLAATGAIELVVHGQNRGFVASVNEGMARHPDRDVLLLNSDTEVAPGWLDRLAACAASGPAIGTVTPFSSNATICSYPRTLAANALPEGETTASLDAAFAAANAGRSAGIVTAVGFCMYITRRCLQSIGPFDEARYGRGYGEEVDFCMRAARAGFRNVIAGDVFVRHVGEVSFGGSGLERRAEAQAMVDALYPEFQVKLRAFLAEDPVMPLRRRADLERLRRSKRPRRLCLAADATAADVEQLVLEPAGARHVSLRWDRPGEEFRLWFALEEWERLRALLQVLGAADGGRAGEGLPELEARWLSPPAQSPEPALPEPRLRELAQRLRQGEHRGSFLRRLFAR